MKRYALKTLFLWLSAGLLLAGCGNKGPLVKPEPVAAEAGTAQ
jgi:predicted small lipoprotein YifL